jgi:hypothetical protein
MLSFSRPLSRFIRFDEREFEYAAWLHNFDRVKAKQGAIRANGIGQVCRCLLKESALKRKAIERIVDAVEKHSKMDQPDDSPLLTALRSADRLDWLGVIGIAAAAMSWGENGFYGNPDPFRRWHSGEKKNFYQDFMFQTEWYRMLPSDGVRSLADPYMPARLLFIRAFAAEVSARLHVPNPVEDDLQKALGKFYVKWRL